MKIKSYLLLLFFTVKILVLNAQGFDYQTLKNIEKLRSPSDDKFNKFMSNSAAYVSLGVPAVMFGVGLIKNDKNLKRQGLEVGVAFCMTVGETWALKSLIKRPRPYVTHTDLSPLSYESSKSFPSGHTSASFSIATSLSLNFPKWYVIAPAYLWASATAYSRMYKGVHYPTDVLAGALLGSGTAWLTWKLHQKWFK